MTLTSKEYLKRQPEHIVLQGYRLWTMGVVSKDPSYLDRTWDLFASVFGKKRGRILMDALVKFVKTLGLCASCPLKTHSPECEGLLRDEVLILGLISGIQHSDEQTVVYCLDMLSCSSRCEEVESAASEFALLMRGLEQMLLPIPHNALRNLATHQNALHAGSDAPTIH